MGASQVVHLERYQPEFTPSDFGLPWEELAVTTKDRISIAGWLIRHPHPTGVVILLHGRGTGKADLLDVARALFDQGPFHLILIDFRGHGNSGGKILTYGQREICDIESVLDFLSKEEAFQRLPVGIYGISMGGAIGILAAAKLTRIQAVVTDSAYADFPKAVARVIQKIYRIPRFPLGQMVLGMTQLRLGLALHRLDPAAAIGKISPRPVLIIHGAMDQSVPVEESTSLFQAAGEPKELWIVPGAEHVASFYQEGPLYGKRVSRFFQDAFRAA